MINKKELSKEELEMYLRAILEKPIDSKDLLAEIFPLLDDYFIGEFALTNESIIMNMLNNQKFEITIKEIK